MTFELETAPNAASLRRVAIDPVSRVEGHGKVTILLDADDRVHQVRLHIVEFRGFEKFVQGRPYWELPVMVQRLCGICPVSHHLAAAKALDIVVGASRLTPTAEKVRRLMHYGQILQSHALHFFHLSSPDLLFGFDSDVSKRNIVGVAAEHPDIARRGVLLRKYGQEVIRVTAGKRVHGTGAIPGGVNKSLTRGRAHHVARRRLPDDRVGRDAVTLIKKLHLSNVASLQQLRRVPLQHDVAGGAGRRARSLPRRAARAGRGRQDPVRPRRLRPLLGPDHRRGEALVVHEVPIPARARSGGWLVQGRPARARSELRPHPDAVRRCGAPRVRRLRRRTADRTPRSPTTGRA